MGRHKYDKFPSDMLSEGTIEAIKKELIASGKIDKNLYDWGVFNISIKRANMAQRHRFVESLKKLREYCDTNDVYWTSIPDVARITGRNVKTIRDWINKGFIPVARIGYISPSTYIVLEEAIKSLSGLIYNSKLKKIKPLNQQSTGLPFGPMPAQCDIQAIKNRILWYMVQLNAGSIR